MQATAGKRDRPYDFDPNVKMLLEKMAHANGYRLNIYDSCHIVPWKFIKDMVNIKSNLKDFINDLAVIHDDAAFFKKLGETEKRDIRKYTKEYQKEAIRYDIHRDKENLKTMLFNFPSNLYPGNGRINKKIAEKFDPPRKGKEIDSLNNEIKRVGEASRHAKDLYKKYKALGLQIVADRSGKALSSDKPPGDDSYEYIEIRYRNH